VFEIAFVLKSIQCWNFCVAKRLILYEKTGNHSKVCVENRTNLVLSLHKNVNTRVMFLTQLFWECNRAKVESFNNRIFRRPTYPAQHRCLSSDEEYRYFMYFFGTSKVIVDFSFCEYQFTLKLLFFSQNFGSFIGFDILTYITFFPKRSRHVTIKNKSVPCFLAKLQHSLQKNVKNLYYRNH
jgi:hypothetical protein